VQTNSWRIMNIVSKEETMRGTLWIWIVLATLPTLACTGMSESIKLNSVNLNGGFEQVESGIPVDWLIYSPSTIPSGDYELILDRSEFKEGEQSLHFLVRDCSPTGGWHSPGISQERQAIPGETYKVSFWIKNEGCDYVVSAGGVAAKTGQVETIDSSKQTASSWKHVEQTVTIPEKYDRLRFELSIRSPGRLWIDDVKIEPLTSNPHTAAYRPGLDGAVVVLE